MKLHVEEEDLTERQKCSALTSNLEEIALNCVMTKINTSGTQLRRSLNLVESFWLRTNGGNVKTKR